MTIPLKAPESGALLRVDRCRPAITNTLKVVSVCFEENETAHDLLTGLFSEGGRFPNLAGAEHDFGNCGVNCAKTGSLCRMTHKIRAPGWIGAV